MFTACKFQCKCFETSALIEMASSWTAEGREYFLPRDCEDLVAWLFLRRRHRGFTIICATSLALRRPVDSDDAVKE